MPNPLNRYVLVYFSHLMTNIETAANRSFFFQDKSQYGSDALRSRLRREISIDPEVRELMKDGYEAFASRVVERLMQERRQDIFLNNCPKCGALAHTPTAKQCPACFHSWHDVE